MSSDTSGLHLLRTAIAKIPAQKSLLTLLIHEKFRAARQRLLCRNKKKGNNYMYKSLAIYVSPL
jgi:hypothetical protein